MPLPYKNLSEKYTLLSSGNLQIADNIEYYFNRINSSDLNAFISIADKETVANTASRIKFGPDSSALAGTVVAVKDVIAVKGQRMTCASQALNNFISPYSADCVDRLEKAGAIVIGKTNCDEFAMGSSNENSSFGPVLNPINTSKVPGGSSGGSAAAVAGELCDIALGTDTGGSVRQPAGFCGIYGYKPTYSLISRYGLTAFASSFDSIGIFAREFSDIPEVVNVIAGKDSKDSTSSVSGFNLLQAHGKTEFIPVIAIIKGTYEEGLDPDIAGAFNSLVSKLKNKYSVVEIDLPLLKYAIATYYILTMAEASSNLSRYDGARYGKRAEAATLEEMYIKSRTNGFGPEVKRRIMLGTYVLSSGYYDAYFSKAQRMRRLIQNSILRTFEKVNLILTPTSPTTAFNIGSKVNDPLSMYLSDIFTVPANLAGIPGISFPYGEDSTGLPIGMQLMANQFNDSALFAALHRFTEDGIMNR